MLDLSFGLPITVRDAALKMIAPGPQSEVNREYYAQNHERELEEGSGAVAEAYEKTDEKARDLLRRLANSEPYYKKQRRLEAAGEETEQKKSSEERTTSSYGPIRTQDSRKAAANSQRRAGPGGARAVTVARPPQPEDWLPPRDPNITSLFVTGVEDDLPEHAIRTFFTPFGQIRSIVCSHRAHCAFINYADRAGAEAAAAQCQGKAVIQGCPLRIKWGKPKPLDNTDRDQRLAWAREGREQAAAIKQASQPGQRAIAGGSQQAQIEGAKESATYTVAPPPGQDEANYASMAGD
jgi:pre-mRNA-splicing factor RBM22/SLT11